MTLVLDVLLAVYTFVLPLVVNSTVADATHSGGTVVLQVTLAPGVEPSSLSALTVTLYIENSAATCMMVNDCLKGGILDQVLQNQYEIVYSNHIISTSSNSKIT